MNNEKSAKVSLIYESGKQWFCIYTDYTEGEAHLVTDPSVFYTTDVTWMPFTTEVTGVAYKYVLTQSDTQPSDSDFNNGWDSLTGHEMIKGWYLWIRETVSYSNRQSGVSYNVQRIGEDGEAGIDGISSYLHLAYASSADGSEGFSTTYFEGAGYMGICRNQDPNDPGTSSSSSSSDSDPWEYYTWARILGDEGLSGLSTPPPYTETITHHYLAWNTSTGVTKSTGTWSTTYPDLTGANRYLWQYDEYTYTPVDGVRNLLKNSTVQDNYYELNGSYIAKIRLAEQLTNGQTYTLVFKAEDLSAVGVILHDRMAAVGFILFVKAHRAGIGNQAGGGRHMPSHLYGHNNRQQHSARPLRNWCGRHIHKRLPDRLLGDAHRGWRAVQLDGCAR